MTLRLNGSSSGHTEINAPAAAGDNTITLPTSNGSAEQFLKNSGTAGELEFSSMVETSTGVGIGTGAPTTPLQVHSSTTASTIRITNSTSGATSSDGLIIQESGNDAYIWNKENSFISFGTNNAERARLDSSGRLLVNKTGSPSAGEGANAFVFIQGNTASNTNPAVLALARGQSASEISSGASLGVVTFTDDAGNDFAQIKAACDGSAGTNDHPGRLTFLTTADSSSGPNEKMRIDNVGRIYTYGAYDTTTSSAANVNIASDGILRRSTSSAKYKTNIETLNDSFSDALLACRPVWYRSTCEGDNPDHSWWGFIAEEVAEIDPRLVHWKTTEISHDENGFVVETPCDPEPEGVAYDRFVPHLVNLIKRQKATITAQQAQIDDLLARVTALEAA